MKHLKYLKYIIKHKWFVMIECFKVGLYWQGIIHDLSKFLPDEWLPYANYFYGDFPDHTKVSAAFKYEYVGKYKVDVEQEFDFAWLSHQKRNQHHWQWWILPEDDGGTKVLPMPDKILKEMLCDWIGAGKAQGYGDNTKKWYQKNKDKMKLHFHTRKVVEENIIQVQ